MNKKIKEPDQYVKALTTGSYASVTVGRTYLVDPTRCKNSTACAIFTDFGRSRLMFANEITESDLAAYLKSRLRARIKYFFTRIRRRWSDMSKYVMVLANKGGYGGIVIGRAYRVARTKPIGGQGCYIIGPLEYDMYMLPEETKEISLITYLECKLREAIKRIITKIRSMFNG